MKSNANDQEWSITLDSYGIDMAIDSNNCIYIASRVNLAKYNTSGIQLWNKELEGIVYEPFIKTDFNNNLYLANVYIKETNQTLSWNATLFKFNPLGDLQWQTTCEYDHIADIAVDSDNNIYIYGSLEEKLMLTKYNETGAQIWSLEFQDMGYGLDILIDSNFNIIISGISTSTYWLKSYNASRELQWSISYECESFPLLGLDSLNGIISIASNCSQLDLVKYDNFGNSIWNYKLETASFYLSEGIGPPIPMKYRYDLSLDLSDSIYLGWEIEIPNEMYNTDILMIKVNSSGTFEWFLTWGGPDNDYISKIRTDSDNNIYLLAGNMLVKNPVSNGKTLFRTNLWDFYFILFGIFCGVSLISLYFIIRSKIRSRPIK
ncbi:MAG: hypothetical protein ACFFBH_04520 [Promethearchaeota archaeon]